MRRRRYSDQAVEDTGIDLTPMLDVVFIMLIFFIVTSTFIKESGVEVNRPQANSASAQDNANILIAVTADGQVWLDKQAVDVRSVRSHVERLRQEHPEGLVVVQADQEARTGLVVQVMDQARLAGVTDVALAASTESR
ncbi:biopolymer transporter ExbD [Thiopseudomonas alkaliphila]|uniref:Biopolymer transporter ExbD n=1 Tax=Thiopseudomonas alkaliphila TaxID=1697053 RepID=A0A0K1XBQ9_9GAMM|nr:biopolymer transporter ExbD [Thiopseudomonas alkaliphila]AKX44299.1 biopolymer transporter ExbD [Thiopseudomonas alkaliphila]AKX46498.1 biopolymer transporter ExbD [Thiopseudomonas alkaliphila]AKX49571.1 biopolymer transporter ExbD [Thiopseudomonas alkaliphila]AKX50320.1 biopolymer transporter ExbD [Thiopseudomonas alkaliphila]AKX52519.1 biopolymer transporter ExbD [Thiopseudomonas alkaliphila]